MYGLEKCCVWQSKLNVYSFLLCGDAATYLYYTLRKGWKYIHTPSHYSPGSTVTDPVFRVYYLQAVPERILKCKLFISEIFYIFKGLPSITAIENVLARISRKYYGGNKKIMEKPLSPLFLAPVVKDDAVPI